MDLVPPEPMLEWVMLFGNGRPASAVLRTKDLERVRDWAGAWPAALTLHHRLVLEGPWSPAALTLRPLVLEGWHWFPHVDAVRVQPDSA